MIVRYILKNFSRRWIRTLLMLLSLAISTALIVAMSATVETIRRSNVEILATAVGRFDIEVSKTDISPDPFVIIDEVQPILAGADETIQAIYPRFVAEVELARGEDLADATMIARVPGEEIGLVEVISGTESFENDGVLLLESTANAFNVGVGDEIDISYSFPQPREAGEPVVVGISQRRVRGRFTVNGIVRQSGVVGAETRDAVFLDFNQAQDWLELEGRAGSLIALVDPVLYESGNAETAAMAVRQVGINVQDALGEEYSYGLTKAQVLDQTAQGFLVLQALINTYGLMAFGVVGLLIHTLVMTNVQEQRRELAILRILGSLRNYLFTIVMAEVAIIGVIGVSIGVVLGQLLTRFGVVPFIESQIANEGLTVTIQPEVSLTVIIPAVISAFIVLFISALKPARDASKTKVMYAINPGVADNIQLEDLEGLREQRPNLRFFVWGLVVLAAVSLVLGLDIVSSLGNPALEASFFLIAILLMVLGLGFTFLIMTRPLERFILFLIRFIAPRMTFFAARNVGRSNKRNTLISLLVLFSGVLPSFLATQNALEVANIETTTSLDMGGPINMQIFTPFRERGTGQENRLRPSFLETDLAAIEGIDQAVGFTWDYRASISDVVNMRRTPITVHGVTGDLNDVLFDQYIEFSSGDRTALTDIVANDNVIIVSEGLSELLAIPLGGTLELTGEGLDHTESFTVIGVARRMPGFNEFGRARSRADGGSVAFVSLDAFHRLTTDPKVALPELDAEVMTRIIATVEDGADVTAVNDELLQRYGFREGIWARVYDVELQQAQDQQRQSQIFLLVLTLLSFTTAVFGVFAVIYVTIYARRLEIGMMKAVGTRRWELTGMLSIESIAMTLSAALAGIIAGGTMGYVFAYIDNVTNERPMVLAFDTTVMPFVVILVVLASIIGTIFSARRIVRYKAIEILRMS